MAEETLTRRVVIYGFVQGVGYRDFARRAAMKHGVSGWVRNRMDGTVEALVSGRPAAVEAMLAELRRGPRGAEVTGAKLAEPGEAQTVKAGVFVILPTV